MNRLEECVGTAESGLKLLREILERIQRAVVAVRELRRRSRPDCGQTFLNQLPLNFPVIER